MARRELQSFCRCLLRAPAARDIQEKPVYCSGCEHLFAKARAEHVLCRRMRDSDLPD
jgi:hypothetical protein